MQEQIAGTERVQRMYASAAGHELHIQEFLSANCFGDHVAANLNALAAINEIAPASANGTAEA